MTLFLQYHHPAQEKNHHRRRLLTSLNLQFGTIINWLQLHESEIRFIAHTFHCIGLDWGPMGLLARCWRVLKWWRWWLLWSSKRKFLQLLIESHKMGCIFITLKDTSTSFSPSALTVGWYRKLSFTHFYSPQQEPPAPPPSSPVLPIHPSTKTTPVVYPKQFVFSWRWHLMCSAAKRQRDGQ